MKKIILLLSILFLSSIGYAGYSGGTATNVNVDLNISGEITISTVTVTGSTTIYNSIEVLNPAGTNLFHVGQLGNIGIGNNITGTNKLDVTGNVGISGITKSGTLEITGKSDINGASTFDSSMTVNGNLALNGYVDSNFLATKFFDVTGIATFGSSVTINNDAFISGKINSDIQGTAMLDINGTSTFDSSVTVNSSFGLKTGENYVNAATFASSITVNGSELLIYQPLAGSNAMLKINNGGNSATSGVPSLQFIKTTANVNEHIYDFINNDNKFYGRCLNDAENAAGNWIEVTRNASTPTRVNFPTGNFDVGGATTFTSSVTVNSGLYLAGSVIDYTTVSGETALRLINASNNAAAYSQITTGEDLATKAVALQYFPNGSTVLGKANFARINTGGGCTGGLDIDISAGALRMQNAGIDKFTLTSTGTVIINGIFQPKSAVCFNYINITSGSYVTSNDYYVDVTNPTNGAVSIYLGDLDNVVGRTIVVTDTGGTAGVGNITIAPETAGSATINGAANYVISTASGTVSLHSNGTNWKVH